MSHEELLLGPRTGRCPQLVGAACQDSQQWLEWPADWLTFDSVQFRNTTLSAIMGLQASSFSTGGASYVILRREIPGHH
jgi:hypothetical protein